MNNKQFQEYLALYPDRLDVILVIKQAKDAQQERISIDVDRITDELIVTQYACVPF